MEHFAPVSARLIVAICALLAGCAGRTHARGPAQPDAYYGYPPTAQSAGQLHSPASSGGTAPAEFPEIRGSAAAVAAFGSPVEAPSEVPPPLEVAPGPPLPDVVDVPEGVSADLPFDVPAPIPFHPPTQAPMPRRALPPLPLPPPRVTVALPGGETCLARLTQAGVAFRPFENTRGIETPIVVEGPIGGIRYYSAFGPMVCDCRFALALATAAPALSALGVTEMRFSGAYSYRMSKVGRLSLHAYGLALDVHEIVVDGRTLNVERHFARGIGCGAGPALNHVACKLRDLGLFRELLTPDYNADHNNHFHLGIAPLGPIANQIWDKHRAPPPSPTLPVLGEGSRLARSNRDRHPTAKPSAKSMSAAKTTAKATAQVTAQVTAEEETDQSPTRSKSKKSAKRRSARQEHAEDAVPETAEAKPAKHGSRAKKKKARPERASTAAKSKSRKSPKRVGALEKGGAS